MIDPRTLRAWARWLRKRFPALYPVRIRQVPAAAVERTHGDKGWGDCRFHDRSQTFSIRLADNLSSEHACQALIHEWAHVARWHLPEGLGDDPHDALFHVIEGTINKAWTEEEW